MLTLRAEKRTYISPQREVQINCQICLQVDFVLVFLLLYPLIYVILLECLVILPFMGSLRIYPRDKIVPLVPLVNINGISLF